MASADVQLITAEAQVCEARTHVHVLESQLGKTETELQFCPHEMEAALLESIADHRRVDSSRSFQNLPEDVLREICTACIGADLPILTSGILPLPYMLMQISSGMRRIVRTTPSIWASIHIQIDEFSYFPPNKLLYTALVCEAEKWFERAGCLALSIFVENLNNSYTPEVIGDEIGPDPANILFDFLLSFSRRWKSIRVSCSLGPTLITRIAALSAADVPQLRSVSIHFELNTAILSSSTFFTIPTLEHLTLQILWIPFYDFAVNWASLTSLTLRRCRRNENPSAMQIGGILQQTKRLSFCDISIGGGLITHAEHPGEITLPLLKVLYIDEGFKFGKPSGIIDLIHAPILEVFHFHGEILEASSASRLFVRSPNIRELSLCYAKSLTDVTEVLHSCPELTEFSLQPHWLEQRKTLDANTFLKTFVLESEAVICPRLEYFKLVGLIDVSLQTLREFLEAKRRGVITPNGIRPWKGVAIDLSGIADTYVRQQMLDLFSQKLKEGVNVSVAVKKKGLY